MKPEQIPTILCYGEPKTSTFRDRVIKPGQLDHWARITDDGYARDSIFTMYENFARADAIVVFPNANPVHMTTVIAELEVWHPLLQQKPEEPGEFQKPVVFCGTAEEFAPFRAIYKDVKSQGLARGDFEHLIHYEGSPARVREYIEENLLPEIPTTRLNYYFHTRTQADMDIKYVEGRPASNITVSCFGSASTQNPEFLERTDRAALTFARNNWNILHGHGDYGVMGQLSESAQKYKAHVIGVGVHASGAPAIYAKELSEVRKPVDQSINSKDMLHRIESYAGNAHAFVSLDGGLGSIQEIIVIAELLSKRHPVVTYEDTNGNEEVKKPLWVVNESGIYTELMFYLQQSEFAYLRDEFQVAENLQELENGLQRHFEQHRPKEHDLKAGDFRADYDERKLPVSVIEFGKGIEKEQFPDLNTLPGGHEERKSDRENEIKH